jgi:Glyoxalase-like domain
VTVVVVAWTRAGSDPVKGRSLSSQLAAGPLIDYVHQRLPEAKTIKNRVHLDLTTGADDRDAEIERLLRRGARPVNIGQTSDESWTVLADPEDNEFCVVCPKTTLIR